MLILFIFLNTRLFKNNNKKKGKWTFFFSKTTKITKKKPKV